MKQAKIFISNTYAGILTEDEAGYEFKYPIKHSLHKKLSTLYLIDNAIFGVLGTSPSTPPNKLAFGGLLL